MSALPRIDDVTPPQRNHVYYKFKKLQTEVERHAQIERDNFILLKHLSDIMTAKRIDNIWLYNQPKYEITYFDFQITHIRYVLYCYINSHCDPVH